MDFHVSYPHDGSPGLHLHQTINNNTGIPRPSNLIDEKIHGTLVTRDRVDDAVLELAIMNTAPTVTNVRAYLGGGSRRDVVLLLHEVRGPAVHPQPAAQPPPVPPDVLDKVRHAMEDLERQGNYPSVERVRRACRCRRQLVVSALQHLRGRKGPPPTPPGADREELLVILDDLAGSGTIGPDEYASVVSTPGESARRESPPPRPGGPPPADQGTLCIPAAPSVGHGQSSQVPGDSGCTNTKDTLADVVSQADHSASPEDDAARGTPRCAGPPARHIALPPVSAGGQP